MEKITMQDAVKTTIELQAGVLWLTQDNGAGSECADVVYLSREQAHALVVYIESIDCMNEWDVEADFADDADDDSAGPAWMLDDDEFCPHCGRVDACRPRPVTTKGG